MPRTRPPCRHCRHKRSSSCQPWPTSSNSSWQPCGSKQLLRLQAAVPSQQQHEPVLLAWLWRSAAGRLPCCRTWRRCLWRWLGTGKPVDVNRHKSHTWSLSCCRSTLSENDSPKVQLGCTADTGLGTANDVRLSRGSCELSVIASDAITWQAASHTSPPGLLKAEVRPARLACFSPWVDYLPAAVSTALCNPTPQAGGRCSQQQPALSG